MPEPLTYLIKLWRDENLLANWPPDRMLFPGQIVTRDAGGSVTIETTIADVASTAGEPLPSMELDTRDAGAIASQEGAKFEAAAQAGGPGVALDVTFSRAGGYTLKAEGGAVTEMRTIAPWRELVTRLEATRRWHKGWQLVTHVRNYERITVVRANQADQRARFKGLVPAGVVGASSVSAGGGLASSSSGCSVWVVDHGATLGYEGLEVVMRLVRSNAVVAAHLSHPVGELTRRAIVQTAEPNWKLGE